MTPDTLNQHLQRTLSRGRVATSAPAPAGCPSLPLYLFDPSVLEGPLSHDEAQAVVAEPDNRPLLEAFRAAAEQVLLADSRVKHLGNPAYVRQAIIEARTWPDLNEFEEFNQVRIYLAGGSGDV